MAMLCSRTCEKIGAERLLLEARYFQEFQYAVKVRILRLVSNDLEVLFLLRVAIGRANLRGILAHFRHIEEFESPRQELQVPVE